MREPWERYLNDVVSHVRFAFDRRKIRQELAEHMEDLYEDLLSQDIDEKQAAELTVDYMGDSEEMCIRDSRYNTGREGTDKERFQVGAQLLKEGIDIPLEYSYDTEKMKAKLTEIVEEFDRHAVDSTVSRKNGKFVVTPEETGRIMDQEKTEANAAAVLDTRMSGTAKIEAEVEEPKITAEANSHVTDLSLIHIWNCQKAPQNRFPWNWA